MALSEKAKAKAAGKGSVAVGVGEPAPAPQDNGLSILKKAANIGVPSTLVIGNSGSGKSSLVRDMLLKAGEKPLWLPFNNTAALTIPEVQDWDTAVPADWNEFINGIYKPIISGEISGYDALVIDGGDVLAAYALSKQAPSGQAERSDWLIASNLVRDNLVKLRGKFKELYMIVDTVADKDTGGRKINLNPYIKNNLVPLFGQKLYTHVVRERGEGNKLTGKLIYTVQRNPMLSLEFVVGEAWQL